ncbi:sensor histidine kinase [Streptacidiphilus sp. P02-A3a]|uniref:sensor histidine kinase n=1 Tax=Streptacidiphilus sp. P02-A3a TaxID=2704468 RepID=UPI0015FD4350|nr:histidine kinase [Streptacidiphilus sp. P02-A3a]QMU73436.1 sensor histidine kinase [Streptacidiphilus sp. P02-A3a]
MIPTTARLRELTARALRPAGELPRPNRRNQVFDVLLALVLGVVAMRAAQSALGDSGGQPLGHRGPEGWLSPPLTALLTAVPLVLRRRYPLAVLWVVMAVTLLGMHDLPRGALYAGVIAAYSAAAYSPYRIPRLATLLLTALLFSVFGDSGSYSVPSAYVPFLLLVPIVVAADGIRTWKHRADQDRARLSALEQRQVAAMRRAVAQERARIARELHDVVTHNVSVMVIQAGAARTVMAVAPDQAAEALLAVEAGGRAALVELRQVMGLLTMDAEEAEGAEAEPATAVELAPQPGLDRLAALVERVRRSGVPVRLTVVGTPRPVPSGVELAGYRVVQEALTNMVKHAVGAEATVTVEYRADRLRVEVVDTGGRPGPSAASGGGRGLIGLRERIAVYGGTLHSGPRPTGGYRVRALIPLETS